MKNKKREPVKIVGLILFITLIVSVIYSFVRFLMAPTEIAEAGQYVKVKSDYLLMLTQCLLGLVVMSLPSMLNRRWKIVVPNTIIILYYIFLYCAIYLGEIFDFYYRIPFWDNLLHAFSGAMLGALGFVLVDILNKDSHVRVNLSPFFVSLFAFSFALAVGALWEVYEFSFDALLGLNMQKHTMQDGTLLLGKSALFDTMIDIIVDAVAALLVAVLGYILGKRKKKL